MIKNINELENMIAEEVANDIIDRINGLSQAANGNIIKSNNRIKNNTYKFAKIIAKGLESIGIKYYGAENSPYIWFKVPDKFDSWSFFDYLLEKANIVGTPGVGFGAMGEGYFRLTGFADSDSTKEAVERIKNLSF